jgi:hypothetical protein
MPDTEVVSAQQRDALFNKLRDDPAFRDAMKKDWRAAVQQLHINPATVAKGTLSRSEVGDFLAQAAGWTIEIVISSRATGAERVEMKDGVNFAAR